jgi:hypothetical protein
VRFKIGAYLDFKKSGRESVFHPARAQRSENTVIQYFGKSTLPNSEGVRSQLERERSQIFLDQRYISSYLDIELESIFAVACSPVAVPERLTRSRATRKPDAPHHFGGVTQP